MFPSVIDKKSKPQGTSPDKSSNDTMSQMLEVLSTMARSQHQMLRRTQQLIQVSDKIEQMTKNSTQTVRLLKRLDKRLGIANQKLSSLQRDEDSDGKHTAQKQELEIQGKSILAHLSEEANKQSQLEKNIAQELRGMGQQGPLRNPALNAHLLASMGGQQMEMGNSGMGGPMPMQMPLPNPFSMVKNDFDSAARASFHNNAPNPNFQGIVQRLQNAQNTQPPPGGMLFSFPPNMQSGLYNEGPSHQNHNLMPNPEQQIQNQMPPMHPEANLLNLMQPPQPPMMPPPLSMMAPPFPQINPQMLPFPPQGLPSLPQIQSFNKLPDSTPYVINSQSNTVRVPFSTIQSLFLQGKCPELPHLKYEISVWVGHLLRQLSNITYEQLINEKIDDTASRQFFSQSLILNIFDLINFFRRVNADFWNLHRQGLLEWLEMSQRKVLEFLKTKYPRNRRVFKPLELEKELDSINNSEDPRFDIIRNIGLSFKKMDNQSHYIRHIKLFFNKLISLVDQEYPAFHSNMKNILTAPDGGLDVKIGKKFKDNTPQFSYQELETLHFKCRSPEILRILIKWVEEIEQIIDGPKSILNKKAFKHVDSTVDNSVPVSHTMKKEVVDFITKKKSQTQKVMQRKHFEFHNLIDNIMELTRIRPDNTEFLSQDDLRTIKISKMVAGAIPFFVIDRIEHIINIFRSIPEQLRGTVAQYIDLVTFKVFDLLRCRAKGTTKQIIHVYKEIKKASKYLTIIRVKDRLDTPLNDILINCKINDSPLICEIQLTTNTEDNFAAHTNDHFNHFLYELERSKYGPICEACLIINDSDPKMSYAPFLKKINFHMEQLTQDQLSRIQMTSEPKLCYRNHPLNFVRYESPFICSLCNQINYPYQAPFGSHQCSLCNLRICCACWLERLDINARRDQFYFKISKTDGSLYLPKIIQLRNYSARLNLDQLLAKIVKEQGLKYCALLRFSQGKIRKRGFKLLSNGIICQSFYSYNFGVVENLGKVERFDVVIFPRQDKLLKLSIKELKDYTDWDLLSNQHSKPALDDKVTELNLGYVCWIEQKKKKAAILDFNEEQIKIQENLKNQELSKIIKDCSKTKVSSLDISSMQLKNLSLIENSKDLISHVLSIVADENSITQIQPFLGLINLKKLSLKDNKIKQPEIKINLPQFIDIYLGGNQYQAFPLFVCNSLKRLMFIQNKISNIDKLLASTIPNLEQLNLNHNEISDFPILKMPKLKKLFFTDNRITSLANLPKCQFPVVEVLKFDNNSIQETPVINFPTLNFYGLKNNKLKDINNLKDSNLPAIFHLRVSQNFITVFPAECNLLGLKKIDVSHNQLTDLSTIVNKKFKELEEVNASHNKITSIGKIKSKTLRKLDISFNNINLDTDETSPFHSSAVPQLEEIAIKQQSDGRVFTDAEVLESVERVIPLLKLIK